MSQGEDFLVFIASRIYSVYFYFIIIILLVLSHDYSYKKDGDISPRDITRNLRNFRPTFELREQFLYNNAVWLSYSPVLSVLKGVT